MYILYTRLYTVHIHMYIRMCVQAAVCCMCRLQCAVCVGCSVLYVQAAVCCTYVCAGFSVLYVQAAVCCMCRLQCAVCAGCSVLYV